MIDRKNWLKEKYGHLNKDQHTRDVILGIEHQKYIGGLTNFINLDLEKLEKLIKENFINLDQKQNNSPPVQEFYEFMKKNPCVKAHGYAVSSDRSDYRVSIEGLHYVESNISGDLQLEFAKFCRTADSFTCTSEKLYSWWD